MGQKSHRDERWDIKNRLEHDLHGGDSGYLLDVARDFLSAFSVVILSEWQSVLGGASSSAQGSGVAIRWSSGQWGRGKDGGRSTAIGHEPYS